MAEQYTRKQAKAWLIDAREDLNAARTLFESRKVAGIVAFHCQQCVGKCFKAVLDLHEQRVQRTHDLITLRGHFSAC